jgi:hypothetical protein
MTDNDLRDFIREWHLSRDTADLVRRTGLDRRAASNLAAILRRRGVPLPKMPSGKPAFPPDVVRRTLAQWNDLARYSRACQAAQRIARYRLRLAPDERPPEQAVLDALKREVIEELL